MVSSQPFAADSMSLLHSAAETCALSARTQRARALGVLFDGRWFVEPKSPQSLASLPRSKANAPKSKSPPLRVTAFS